MIRRAIPLVLALLLVATTARVEAEPPNAAEKEGVSEAKKQEKLARKAERSTTPSAADLAALFGLDAPVVAEPDAEAAPAPDAAADGTSHGTPAG